MDSENKAIKAFRMHGVFFHESTGSQLLGDCPFCTKAEHFYVNKKTLLWDCKICGESGNLQTFLSKINERNKKSLTEKAIKRLAEDRGLPVNAFKNWEIGFYKGQYTFAIRDARGKLSDLRIFKLNSKVISTAGCKIELFNLPAIIKDTSSPIFLCEGEWDTIAMQYLLKRANKAGIALCSPGANVFKVEWAEYFKNREVNICYDNDEAGKKGTELVIKRLALNNLNLKFIAWPEKYALKYDIRDFVIKNYIETKKPKTALKILLALLKFPENLESKPDNTGQVILQPPPVDPSITLEDVKNAYLKKMKNPYWPAVELCIISVISNFFQTRPLWYFLVAPPSSGKTEIINGFKYLQPPYDNKALFISNLTPHTLISGMKTPKDPSLLAQLENNPKAVFIKDFTPILNMQEGEKNEIFSQFRDVHDGYSAKEFGNGVSRKYTNLNFSITAGVTFEIYNESALANAMGERFGKLIIPQTESFDSTQEKINMVLENIGHEVELDDSVARVMHSYIHNLITRIQETIGKDGSKLPKIPDWAKLQIGAVASYTAHMRAGVSRDKFRKDYIKSKPTVEQPMRFASMIGCTAVFRALMYGRTEVNEEDLALIRTISLDTVNQRDEEILRQVYILNNKKDGQPTKRNIQQASAYTYYTVEQVLQDFEMVGVLKTELVNRRIFYKFTKNMSLILSRANIYKNKTELNRNKIAIDSLEKKRKRKKKIIIKGGVK